MATPFKPQIGKARLPIAGQSTHEVFTAQVREQMQHIIKEFQRWALHMDQQGAEILKDALKPVFDESQILVPKDTRALMRSGYLESRQFRGKTQVEMGYGRSGVPPYAAIVHERLDLHHESPTQAKFLQQPILADFDGIQKRIIQGYKEASSV